MNRLYEYICKCFTAALLFITFQSASAFSSAPVDAYDKVSKLLIYLVMAMQIVSQHFGDDL